MCSAIDLRITLSFTSSSRLPSTRVGATAGARGAARARRGLDLGDHRSHAHRLALTDGALHELALERRGDLGLDLVGHVLDYRLISLDEVAFLFEPLVDGALGYGLAELRHLDWRDGHFEFECS